MSTPLELIDAQFELVTPKLDDVQKVLVTYAMKNYAKQWVEEAAHQLNVTPRLDLCVEWIKKDIDAQ